MNLLYKKYKSCENKYYDNYFNLMNIYILIYNIILQSKLSVCIQATITIL